MYKSGILKVTRSFFFFFLKHNYKKTGVSLVVQLVKNPPAMRENWVWFLCVEDPLDLDLVWSTPWTEKPGRLQSMGSQRVGHNWMTFTSLHFTRGLITLQVRSEMKVTRLCLTVCDPVDYSPWSPVFPLEYWSV